MPQDVGQISLNVVHGSSMFRVKLELPKNRAGDALSLHHLTAELERLTGVPPRRQNFVVEGDVNTALRKDMMRGKLDTPLHLVGITNKVKLHMYGDKMEPWNDEGWVKLQDCEKKYEQLKQQMNRVLHTMNILNGRDVRMEDERTRQRELENLAMKLVDIRHQTHTIKKTIIETEVLCSVNQLRAGRLKARLCSNMDKRLEEIETIIFALRQNNISKRAHLTL